MRISRTPVVRFACAAMIAGLTIAAAARAEEDALPLPAMTASIADLSLPAGGPLVPTLADPAPDYADDGAEIIRERYPDGKVKIERQVALDDAGNYVNHGEWKLLNPTGNVTAEGHFNMGSRLGPWMKWHSAKDAPALNEMPFKMFKGPFQSQANFVDDEMDGEWLLTDSAQRKVMQISLSHGKRHGVMTLWLPNGNVYRQSTFDNAVPVGDVLESGAKAGDMKRVATYLDGRKLVVRSAPGRTPKLKKSEEQVLEPTTVQDEADDFWTLSLATYRAEGEELLHGPSRTWYDSGQLQQEGFYEHGKRTGTFTHYFENGQVAVTGEYRDDKPQDAWVWWHANGQKATVGQYAAGRQVGQWRWWREDGTLVNKQSYEEAEGLVAEPGDDDYDADDEAEVDMTLAPTGPLLR